MCSPRGIAAAVDAKNMPPACFLNAPTVLQEIINTFGSSVPEALAAFGTFFELMCGPHSIVTTVFAEIITSYLYLKNKKPALYSCIVFILHHIRIHTNC